MENLQRAGRPGNPDDAATDPDFDPNVEPSDPDPSLPEPENLPPPDQPPENPDIPPVISPG